MRFDNRGPRIAAAKRRSAYHPTGEDLEDRLLLSGFSYDLGGAAPPSQPNIATTGGGGPFGVQLAGGLQPGGAGYSVADVGDVNNDGFDDFLISAPSVASTNGQIGLAATGTSTVYLVFGSAAVTAGTVDWLTLNATGQRVGDLTQLGQPPANQLNPITGLAGFPYSGITFTVPSQPNAQLGASVAGVTIGTTPALLIGAPGALDANLANPGTGRAYLIFGGAGLNSLVGQTINLDAPGTQGANFITFTNGGPGSTVGLAKTGMSVAGPGDIFTDQNNDVAIGAPGATIAGAANAGAVYLIDGKSLPVGTQTINLSTVGQTSSSPVGVIFTGSNAGDQSGFSVAGAGSVNFQLTSNNQKVPDLLIGAPGGSKAYLVNGGSSLLTAPLSGAISLSRLGDPRITNPPNPNIPPAPGTVPGAIFVGQGGDGTGYSVSSAGDFNDDGINDILIGSPFSNLNAGLVTMFYGANFTTTSTNSLVGTISLNPIPSNLAFTQFTGAQGNLAGFSLSQLGTIGSNPANPILIGAPGTTVGAATNAGAVYVIPGRSGGQPPGPFALSTVVASAISATMLTYSSGGSLFFGSSVSGRLTSSSQSRTADADTLADIIVGASGYSAIPGRILAGSAMIVEGAFIQLATPDFAGLSPVISVDQKPLASGGPYPVNASTPNTVKIWVNSIAGADPFTPFTDIDLTTINVNGVSFTPPNVSIQQIPDENGDGIPDAILTIQPRSALQLTTATTTFTLNGKTLPNTPNPSQEFSSTVAITVTGGGGGGGGGGSVASATPIGLVLPTDFVPHFGPDQFTPSTLQLSVYNYQAIPLRRAIQQFLPPKPFRERMLNYFFPKQYHFQPVKTGTGFTLGQHVFDTSKIHGNKAVVFRHKVLVVPTNRQTEKIWP